MNRSSGATWARKEHLLPKADQQKLLRYLDDAATKAPRAFLHSRLIVRLILQSGLRASEVANLEVRDCDVARPPYCIRVRGGKWREGDEVDEVVIPVELAAELRKACEGCESHDPVISWRRGLPYSRQSIWRIVADAGRRAGVKLWPHLLRHRYGTTLYSKSRDVFVTQQQLRHKDPKTTMGYVHLDALEQRLQGVVDRLGLEDGLSSRRPRAGDRVRHSHRNVTK